MAYKRFVAAGDIHGSAQDPSANKAFFKFVDLWKPDIRVCGGDLWDFRPLRKAASADEKRESMAADYEAGKEWLIKLKATHFLRGNHDERLWDLAARKDGPLSDYANKGIDEINKLIKSLGCKMFPYDRREGVLRIGKLKIVHGFCTGVNAARRLAQAYGSVVGFHTHTIQHVSIEGIENRMGRIGGCLCLLDMDYLRANIGSLCHRHGFVYGVVDDRTGEYQVSQAEDVNGKFLVATGVTEL